jgi:hypothetical protein
MNAIYTGTDAVCFSLANLGYYAYTHILVELITCETPIYLTAPVQKTCNSTVVTFCIDISGVASGAYTANLYYLDNSLVPDPTPDKFIKQTTLNITRKPCSD